MIRLCFAVASNSAQELNRLAMPYTANGIVETSLVDFDDSRKYEALVLEADVVIRLAHFLFCCSLL